MIDVWHDETERWQRTGHLDQGPCWCADCVRDELARNEADHA